MPLITSWEHEIQLAPEPASVSEARTFVSDHLIAHGLVGLVDDVELVASELATNATLHARTPFEVSLRGDASSVRLSVRDEAATRPVVALAGELASSGRGLTIVDAVSRSWGVASGDGAKSVWASFDATPY